MGAEDVGLGEVGLEEFGVRGAAGEEVAEAGGEVEVVERACGLLEEEEFGGAEDGDGGGAHGDKEVATGGEFGVEEFLIGSDVGGGGRATDGGGDEGSELGLGVGGRVGGIGGEGRFEGGLAAIGRFGGWDFAEFGVA